MDKVAVIELGDREMARHATAQLRESFGEIEREKVEEILEIPLKLEKLLDRNSGCLLLIDSTDQRFVNEVISKVLDLEIEKKKKVQKLIVEKQKESEQAFKKRIQEAARENAEKLAEKIRENPANRYREAEEI